MLNAHFLKIDFLQMSSIVTWTSSGTRMRMILRMTRSSESMSIKRL